MPSEAAHNRDMLSMMCKGHRSSPNACDVSPTFMGWECRLEQFPERSPTLFGHLGQIPKTMPPLSSVRHRQNTLKDLCLRPQKT